MTDNMELKKVPNKKKPKKPQTILHRTTDPKPEARQSALLDPVLSQRLQTDPQSASPQDVLQLQGLVGNRAVGQALGQSSVKEGKKIQRALNVNNQVDANDVTHVKELKRNTIFLLSGNQGDSLIIKIEILPSGHGDRDKWTKYKGRYEVSQELALGILDDTEAPTKLVLKDDELTQLLTVAQTDSPIQIMGEGFGSKSQQLKKESEERKAADNQARQKLAQAVEWHQGADGVMVKMENVGKVVDVLQEIHNRREDGKVKKGDEGEQLKALFTPENVKKLGSVAYYDILTRNWDRFNLERGPGNNINMKEVTGGVIGLDNINSAPGSHLSESGDQWIEELAEMERVRDRSEIIDYAYMSLNQFINDYGGSLVEEWNTDEITKANLAMQFVDGFNDAKAKATNVVMGWQAGLKFWKQGLTMGRSRRDTSSRDAVMKAKEVVFTRQKIVEGSSFDDVQRLLNAR